ncbi:hypothetical protein CPB86DRAFT_790269 [Serendipita vermifera]|nr:hypothetical protein CPB86DRAFT_790269 [Serendipita vermifera]
MSANQSNNPFRQLDSALAVANLAKDTHCGSRAVPDQRRRHSSHYGPRDDTRTQIE